MNDKEKFENCKDHAQTGYCCDAHPGCRECPYDLPDDVYVSLGGKLRQN